ncbi:hypothetical protein COF64_11420 [Bacillus sp. AFS043905]|nr:hypothetical protein COF64_11420 [Bacillus sp. AFS043905]
MVIIKKHNIQLLILSILSVLTLSIGHAYNNQMILLGTLLLFSGLILCSHKKYFLPIMLFYLPWSPILKSNPGSFTFFTLIVPCVFLLILFRGLKKQIKYKVELIILPFFFIAYTLLVKLLNGLPLDMSYCFFIMMMLFVPVYASEYKEEIEFETCVLYLTTGVLTACVASNILMNIPHMLVYIDVYQWEKIGLTRLSGFYGDANFYSVHILVAISSLLIILSKTRKKTLIVIQILAIMALLYYGMLSVSKMFILCIACMGLLWLYSLVIVKRDFLYKLGILFTILFVSGIAIGSNLFSEQIHQYLIRFGMVTDTQSLTTGRRSLYDMYINYLLTNFDNLYFGNGLSNQFLNAKSSHNTLIQIIYQVGLFGSVLLIVWWGRIYALLSNNIKLGNMGKYYFLIIIIAYFMPWIALEMFRFDEFFYITLLAIVAKNYLSANQRIVKIVEN